MDDFKELFKDSEHAALYAAIVGRDARIGALEKFASRLKGGLKVLAVVTPIVVSIVLTIAFK